MQKKCVNCGAIMEDDLSFCTECGNPLKYEEEPQIGRTCPKCGEFVEDEDRFCTSCGYDLATLSASEPEVLRQEEEKTLTNKVEAKRQENDSHHGMMKYFHRAGDL